MSTELRKAHYLSDVPCATCASRVRYKASRNCVACSKRQVKAKRQASAPLPDDLFGNLEPLYGARMDAVPVSDARVAAASTGALGSSPKRTPHNDDPLADLLGDII